MSSGLYEIFALLMRYVYVLIGVLILFMAFRWMRRDARAYKREMSALPDAGLVGEIVDLNTGKAQPLPRDGILGSSRVCDVRVKAPDVRGVHVRFEFVEGKGLCVMPVWRSRVILSGTEIKGRAYALHGTQLQVGGVPLRVRLFAGLKVPKRPVYAPDQAVELQPWSEISDIPVPPAEPFSGAPAEDGDPFVPYSAGIMPEGVQSAVPDPQYEGNYTEDGQMTWQYAYSLEELRQAQATWDEEHGDEAVPYQSPVPRRRRRNRHG